MYSDYEQFLRQRVAQLRGEKNISASKMSQLIGQNKNYINYIENGRSLPSMMGFFYICDYLGVHPKEFFDEDMGSPALQHKLEGVADKLTPRQTALVLRMAERVGKLTGEQADLVAKLIDDMTK